MAQLKPVYLISGSDRPKIRLSIERLRNHFDEGAVEVLAADEHPAEDAVAACNALGLFGGERHLVIVEDVDAWKAPEAKVVAEYLKSPAPETVLQIHVADESGWCRGCLDAWARLAPVPCPVARLALTLPEALAAMSLST